MRFQPQVPSVFLSHRQSTEGQLVAEVARHLGRLGVMPWRDVQELTPGQDLHTELASAIGAATLTAVFLSEASITSDWVDDELVLALSLERTHGRPVVPVFLGDARALVASHPRLSARWTHPERDVLTRLGVQAQDRSPGDIARALARAAIERLVWRPGATPGIVIDQRGDGGSRSGLVPESTVHGDFLRAEGPVLLFRPDERPRSFGETLTGRAWSELWSDISWSLDQLKRRAPGGVREVRIAGAGQLGFGWALGRVFDRTRRVTLKCFPRPEGPGEVLTNQGQDFISPLQGGDPACAAIRPELGLAALAPGDHPEIDLILAPEIPQYLKAIVEYRNMTRCTAGVVWVPTGKIETSDHAMDLVRNVVALLSSLCSARATRHVRVFTALPFHVLPLLSANLTHVVPLVTFMEYDRAAAERGAGPAEWYVPLPLGTQAV